MNIIEVENLVYSSEGIRIIDRFTFRIPKGQFVGVIGPNGGGKTTLVKLLLGLLSPTSGSIRLFGEDPRNVAVRKRLAYVAQRGGNIDPMFPATVEEIVRAGCAVRRFKTKSEMDGVCANVVAHMGISHLVNKTLGNLSGGERQRALIARALTSDPEILFLDEPTDGLDPETRESFYNLLNYLKHNRSLTIVAVSHDVHTIAKHADSAICLKHNLLCHGEDECHLDGDALRNVFHSHPNDISSHHKA